MRILLGYSYYQNPFDVKTWVNNWLLRIADENTYIESFPLTINPPAGRLLWKDLDARWKRGDQELLNLYKELAQKLEKFDVFVNWNGINLHPEFVLKLPTFNVYGCFDDPESSENLSKPVAFAYDLCMIGNIAEIETYKSWGVKNVRFWPLGFFSSDYNPNLTFEDILTGNREIDVALLCERKSGWRAERLDKYTDEFPNGAYFGLGWNNGFFPENKKVKLYQNTKIGPNFHNSTGPINFRTYTIPANGVMLLCDNKSHLGKIFKLNEEAVGFDTVEEAIELTKYYLQHDDERRRIAANGWKRAVTDYNEKAVFKILVNAINDMMMDTSKSVKGSTESAVIFLNEHLQKTKYNRLIYPLIKKINQLRDMFYILRKKMG
jgi:spore maturation protein CgeB